MFNAKQNSIFLILISLIFFLSFLACSTTKNTQKETPNKGVQLGVITYSWRSMSWDAEEILKYCQQAGINSVEMMGKVAEDYAGIPPAPPRLRRREKIKQEERTSYRKNLAYWVYNYYLILM